MKKSKSKAAGTSNDTPGGVEIAPAALANLADRLKLDLASQGQSKIKNTPVNDGKTNGKKERKEKQGNKKESQAAIKANGASNSLAKKSIPAKQSGQKSEKKSTGGSNSEKKSKTASTVNGDGRSTKEKDKKSKADSKQSTYTAKEPAPAKAARNSKSSSTKKDKKHSKTNASKTQESTVNPLLDEILALGGTKEDLDLVENVDSEEDITEEPEPPKKSKGNEKTVLTFLVSLIQLAPARIAGSAQILRPQWKISRCLVR
jgi:hypothetical protein